MIFRIPVHSIVDVITNSSSVIYTEAHNNSINIAKDIINSVLKAAGSDKTADDLFNFTVATYPDDVVDYIQNKIGYAEDEDDDEAKEFVARVPNLDALKAIEKLPDTTTKHWQKRREAYAKWENDNAEELTKLFEGVESDVQNGMPSKLTITTKDGVDIDFARKCVSMFEISESYN